MAKESDKIKSDQLIVYTQRVYIVHLRVKCRKTWGRGGWFEWEFAQTWDSENENEREYKRDMEKRRDVEMKSILISWCGEGQKQGFQFAVYWQGAALRMTLPSLTLGKMHNAFGSGFTLKAPVPRDVIKFNTACLFSTYPFRRSVRGITLRKHSFSMTFITNTTLVFKDLMSALNVAPWKPASVENSNFKCVTRIFHLNSPIL